MKAFAYALLLSLSFASPLAAETDRPSWFKYNPGTAAPDKEFYQAILFNADKYIGVADVANMGVCYGYLNLGNPDAGLQDKILQGLIARRLEVADQYNVPAEVIQGAVLRMQYYMHGRLGANVGPSETISDVFDELELSGPGGYCALTYGQPPED